MLKNFFLQLVIVSSLLFIVGCQGTDYTVDTVRDIETKEVTFSLSDFYQQEFVESSSDPKHYAFRKNQDRGFISRAVLISDHFDDIEFFIEDQNEVYSVIVPYLTDDITIELYSDKNEYPLFIGTQTEGVIELQFDFEFQNIRYVEAYISTPYIHELQGCLVDWNSVDLVNEINVEMYSLYSQEFSSAIACNSDGYIRLIKVIVEADRILLSDNWDLRNLPSSLHLVDADGVTYYYQTNISVAKFANTTTSITLY